jgi:ribosomal protein L7/L12
MLLACDPAAMSDGQGASVPLEYSDLTIEGWHDGFKKISFTKLLQREAGLGLAEAKHATDEVLESRPIRVRVPTDRREGFIDEAKALGIRDVQAG